MMFRAFRHAAAVVGAGLVLAVATIAHAAPTVFDTAALMPRSAQGNNSCGLNDGLL